MEGNPENDGHYRIFTSKGGAQITLNKPFNILPKYNLIARIERFLVQHTD